MWVMVGGTREEAPTGRVDIDAYAMIITSLSLVLFVADSNDDDDDDDDNDDDSELSIAKDTKRDRSSPLLEHVDDDDEEEEEEDASFSPKELLVVVPYAVLVCATSGYVN